MAHFEFRASAQGATLVSRGGPWGEVETRSARGGRSARLAPAMLAVSLLALGGCSIYAPSGTNAPSGTTAGSSSASRPESRAQQGVSVPGPTTKSRAPALEGTEWYLSALSGFANLQVEGKPSLTMRRDGGQFGGYAGCNSYFGNYTRDGEQVKLSVSGMTKRMCDIAGMKQEGAFLGMLRGAARLSVQGGVLHVFDQKGAELARFVPADSSAD